MENSDPVHAPSPKSSLSRLEEIGFELSGEWLLDDGEPRIEVRRYAAAANVLYAFVSDQELLYIGRSGRALGLRMQGYEQGGPPRSVRARNRERVVAMLMLDQQVALYAMPDPGSMLYGSFRVNLAAGLQHSLIEALDPPWNKAGGGLPEAVDPTPLHQVPVTAGRRGADAERTAHGAGSDTSARPSYRFLVGYMYMDKGFFNVPVRYSRLFGKDRERIKILCGRERSTIHGHIDRSCNTNASPRIVGGSALKHWFEEHAGLNNPVDIDILAPNAVWIRNPGTRFE
ncbi:MAG: hypothetical protein IPG43_22820 [Proteobacteria bacterium]|nr:hypothetical protein [Pseudomonadota bacterium]